MTENREAMTSGKEIQMFRYRFVNTATEYERHDMLREDRDSFNKVRSYEIGKTKRPDLSE